MKIKLKELFDMIRELLYIDDVPEHSEIADKWFVKYRNTFILLGITLIIVCCRIISIWYTPDIFDDEFHILNHMQSILSTGYDMNGNYMPLFPLVGWGRGTYTYLYPMMMLLSLVGVSPVRARFMQQVLTMMACLLVALGVKLWSEDRRMFWITFFTGLMLPWGFVQANRIWDPSFVPVYFALHFFFFMLLMRCKEMASKKTYVYCIIAFSSLVLMATVYPSARIPAVAMWIYSLTWLMKEKKIGKGQVIAIVLVSIVSALPLAINLLDPGFNSRSRDLLVFNQEGTLYQNCFLFFKNFAKLCSPEFLFVSGDQIYRHSLPIWGMLRTLSIVPIIALARNKNNSTLVKYMFLCVVMTFISVALTYDYQPHGLRSCTAWMPFVILISSGWDVFFKTQRTKTDTVV